jgi:GT2 family glycosyltransferase
MKKNNKEPKVYVLLVNWNGVVDSIECLSSIMRSNYRNYEIILIDNNSSDNSLKIIERWAGNNLNNLMNQGINLLDLPEYKHSNNISCYLYNSDQVKIGFEYNNTKNILSSDNNSTELDGSIKLHLIASAENKGFGAGNNLGLKLIQLIGERGYIWLLNNDTIVTPSSMDHMVSCAKDTDGLVGGIIFYYHNRHKIQTYGGGYFSKYTGRVVTANKIPKKKLDFINGACFMFNSDVLQSVGYFDENIFLYFEEFDYCFRAKKEGYDCFLSNAVVYHKHGASSIKEGNSFAWLCVFKNKPYVLLKNFGHGLWEIFYIFGLLLSALGFSSIKSKSKASRLFIREWLYKKINI